MVLSVSCLTVSRAGRAVLSDLSFDLMAGQALRVVAAETFGFRLEADLFKSVQIIQGVGCHG